MANQTPENAHKFLIQLANQGRIKLEPAENYTRYKSYGSRGYNGEYTITSNEYTNNLSPYLLKIISSTQCFTKLIIVTGQESEYYQGESAYNRYGNFSIPGAETWYPFVPHIRQINQTGIDWSRVSGTGTSDSKVTLRGSFFSGGYINFVFESTDMATRAAYAIEVLRQSCDPASGTGF
jgi:hypothetical protein